MRTTYTCLVLATLLSCCAPIRNWGTEVKGAPVLGAFGTQEKSVLSDRFKPIGAPQLTTSIALLATEHPFAKTTYKRYQNLKKQSGSPIAITYVDSLPVKPKYLKIQIKDKIGLKTVLNKAENDGARAYLAQDSEYKVVSAISLYLNPVEADKIVKNEGLFLTNTANGSLALEIWQGTRKELMVLPKDEIFDYGVSSFCWGEDRYGKPLIEALTDGSRCPKGTEKDPNKMGNENKYTKL